MRKELSDKAENISLSEKGILPFLSSDTANLKIKVFSQLESTNLTCKQLALEGAPDGTTVIALEQTAGRGRMGRSFFSPPGYGIYLSMLLHCNRPAEQALQITSLAAVAVCHAIQSVTGLKAEIKWVNDIYCHGKKLCGILAEGITDAKSGCLKAIVVGVGINCAHKAEDFPEELRPIVTSIQMETEKTPDLNALAAAVINELYFCASAENISPLMEEYRNRSCVLHQRVKLISAGEVRIGTVLDITDQGYLSVQLENGERLIQKTGEISLRPLDL